MAEWIVWLIVALAFGVGEVLTLGFFLAPFAVGAAVAAVLSGHTHRHRVIPRRSVAGGYWIIHTASLADHPQQVRMVRLVRTRGGGRTLETWVVDHDGGRLAGVARELAYLDVQRGRPRRLQGHRRDRNVRLNLPARGR